MSLEEPIDELGRAEGPHGETVLRRRGEVVELVVNGVFAMDTGESSTEAALASLTLDRLPGGALRIVVGGLGLGVTTATLLADERVAAVDVVELDAALVGWVREGLVPGAEHVLADPRVTAHTGDVAEVLPRLPGGADAVLLDVDNGPDFLVHDHNERVYAPPFLAAAAGRLRRGGILAIWCAEPAPRLTGLLQAACGDTEEVLLPVTRGTRSFDYAIYLSRATRRSRPAGGPAGAASR